MADILQWNCRGLRSRAEELKVLIHDHNPGIICLQETKLGNHSFNPGLNYIIYNSVPPLNDRAKGGAAIILKKSLQHSVLALNTNLQAVAIQCIFDKQLTICSLYLPPDLNFTVNEIQDLINQLPAPFLLLGDFNAHNPLWGGANLDAKGKIVEEILDTNPITLYNDGSMTFHNIHCNQLSAIDLSLCSPSIHVNFLWSVNEYLNGSDHFPIHLKLAENTPTECPPKWKIEGADWSKFAEGIKLEKNFESFKNHIEAYDYFCNETLKSAHNSIPMTKGKPRRPAVPWWDKHCSVLRKVTRKCYRRYKSSASTQSKIIYKRALAKQRKYYKKAKRDSWLYYINGINSKTPMRFVWKKIRKLSGKFVPSPLPTLKINNTIITNPSDVAEHLGKHFSDISSSKNYSSTLQKKIKDPKIVLDLGPNKEVYNAKFSLKELRDVLSSTEQTAPGEDNILYSMIKHLPEPAKQFLLKIINKIWETGILPKTWKIALIIPVKKPGKEASQATSYRPIALTSCVCKIMEKMINTRLIWFLETSNKISSHQFGFRKNRSTLDPLLKLTNQIQEGFARRRKTFGVFFDLEKAYDTTWRRGILEQFHHMGVKGNMMKFLKSFLTDRYIKVRIGNNTSKPFKQQEGVPQGSVLSVTCFIVAINNIMETVDPNVSGSLFVDDFAIYCTESDPKLACNYLQKSIKAACKWAEENGFKFSSSKTVAICFDRGRSKEAPPTLKLNDIVLPYEKEVKFLGMTLDSKLTWSSHIDLLKTKVKKSLNILKVISRFDWGADKKSLLKLYDSLCRSKLDYGCQLYSSACKTKLKELDVAHNMGLRLCSGAFRTSPIESLYVDTNELPLDLRREELGLRYIMRIKSAHKNPSRDILEKTNSKPYKGKRCSKPFHVRLNEEVQENSIKEQKIDEIDHPEIPPWFIPNPKICEKEISKKNESQEEIKAKFLDHDAIHKNDSKLFTDGSKSEAGVGCAIIHDGTSYLAKLPDHASVFTAELTAINGALDLIYNSDKKSFTIYSDSKSAINSLKKYNSFHPLIQKAQEWLFRISCRHKSVHFCWVPSHIGIQGNEMADGEAKHASVEAEYKVKRLPYSDMKRPIRSYILRKWQDRWSSPLLPNNKKYKKIRNSTEFWPSSFNRDRRTEIVLTRLRIGHTKLTHNFILEGGSAPVCACAEILSIEHILVECPTFTTLRSKYHLNGKDLKAILDDDVDIENLMSFLKEGKLFYEI